MCCKSEAVNSPYPLCPSSWAIRNEIELGDVSKLGGWVDVKPRVPEVRKRNSLGSRSVSGLGEIETVLFDSIVVRFADV
jgi:hypothetical protein